MAITYADYTIWKQLTTSGVIPPRPALLEIGQANWYGDVDPQQLKTECVEAGINEPWSDAFDAADSFYKLIFNPSRTVAIDLHGQPDALKLDLNKELDSEELDRACDNERHYGHWDAFDIIINTGTTEHIFNQHQVFKTIHDACRISGLMFHGVPWRGWLNHGFYCYQPTFFYDLAAVNDYEILVLAGFQLGTTCIQYFKSMAEIHSAERAKRLASEMMLYVVLRKTNSEPFREPMQGIYNDAKPLPANDAADWRSMRSM